MVESLATKSCDFSGLAFPQTKIGGFSSEICTLMVEILELSGIRPRNLVTESEENQVVDCKLESNDSKD